MDRAISWCSGQQLGEMRREEGVQSAELDTLSGWNSGVSGFGSLFAS